MFVSFVKASLLLVYPNGPYSCKYVFVVSKLINHYYDIAAIILNHSRMFIKINKSRYYLLLFCINLNVIFLILNKIIYYN